MTIANSEQNKSAVLGSKILAKSVIRRADGKVQILVVFQKSTYHEFYWVFRAKSARSARRSWRYVSHYRRDCMGLVAYTDFQTFVAYHVSRSQAALLSVRVLQRRRLAALLEKVEHESIHTDWTPRIDSSNPRDYQKVNRAFEKNIKGRVLDWTWGKK